MFVFSVFSNLVEMIFCSWELFWYRIFKMLLLPVDGVELNTNLYIGEPIFVIFPEYLNSENIFMSSNYNLPPDDAVKVSLFGLFFVLRLSFFLLLLSLVFRQCFFLMIIGYLKFCYCHEMVLNKAQTCTWMNRFSWNLVFISI